jgi:hypothetical protein
MSVALVCSFAIAGCGGQARTVTVTTSQTTSTTSSSTTSATTSAPPSTASVPTTATTSTASSSVPSWVVAARTGCPPGEMLLTTMSNGQPAPYGNDGCAVSSSGECASSEPTCDPANAPGGTTTQATPPTTTATTTAAPEPTAAPDATQCISLPEGDTNPNHVGCPAGQITRLQAVADQGCYGQGSNPVGAYWTSVCDDDLLNSVPIALYGLPCELIQTGANYSGPAGGDIWSPACFAQDSLLWPQGSSPPKTTP